jgi:hypothetical protein
MQYGISDTKNQVGVTDIPYIQRTNTRCHTVLPVKQTE